MELATLDGTTIQDLTGVIIVAANRYSPCGYYADARIEGRLPGMHERRVLTDAPHTGRIVLMPLHGYTKHRAVKPDDYRAFLASLPVVSHDLFPVELTDAVIAEARASVEAICHCPAVTGRTTQLPGLAALL